MLILSLELEIREPGRRRSRRILGRCAIKRFFSRNVEFEKDKLEKSLAKNCRFFINMGECAKFECNKTKQ